MKGASEHANRRKHNQRGMALIIVLTTLTVLISLAANYLLTVTRDTDSLYKLNSRIQARYSALSGVQYALFAMQDRDKEISWKTDGQLYSVSLAGGEVYVRITPESGRLDINTAREPLLTLLFKYAGSDDTEAKQLANNVQHWRGGNDVRIGDSVTDSDYDAARQKPPAHRRFYSVEELAQVYGITPAIYQKIKSLITVYGSNKISGLVASDEMLRLLELTDADIERIYEARVAYYSDETPIPTEISALSRYLTFSPRAAYYRVMAYGETTTGQFEAVYAVIKNQRSRNGSYREMERGTITGEARKTFVQAVKATKQLTEKK